MIQEIETLTQEPYIYIIVGLALLAIIFLGYHIPRLLFRRKAKHSFQTLKHTIEEGREAIGKVSESFEAFSEIIGAVEKDIKNA